MKPAKKNSIKITYDLTLDDILKFVEHQFRRSPQTKKTMAVYRLLLPGIAGIVISLVLTDKFAQGITWHTGAVILACYVIGFFIIPISFRKTVERATRRMYTQGDQKKFLGQHKTVFDDELITDESQFGTAQYPWSAIISVMSSEQYLYFYISAESAFIIPLRRLGEVSKKDNLLQLIKKKKG